MKLLISTIRICCLLVLVLLTAKQSQAQAIEIDPTAFNTASCSANGGNFSISVPQQALSGDNINLTIQIPGTLDANCQIRVSVQASPELEFVSDGAIPVQAVGGNVFETVNSLPGNESRNFPVVFKFPPYVTCDGTVGTFNVQIEVDCGGQKYQCNTTVEVTARAENYWTVTKQYLHGNMVCGISTWRILVTHNNPNPTGLGTYSISGTLEETIGLDIVSGGIHSVNAPAPSFNGSYAYTALVRNCVPEGSTITNTADYDLTLGNDCANMTGTVSAVSTPMQAPNGSISFIKYVNNSINTNLTPGCHGEYIIQIHNNGNIPWTDIEVTDNLNIPGITLVGAPVIPAGWTTTNSGGVYTFNGNSNVLAVGATAIIRIPFQIDSATPVGSTISNTATIQYQAVGAPVNDDDPEPNTACPGIDCPVVDTAVQNTSATTNFVVEDPRPIPIIRKCIIDAPTTAVPPLYSIGSTIRFQVQIMNKGAAPLSTVISDALGLPNQNLQIIPSSIQYDYFEDISESSINNCSFNGISTPMPFTVTSNTSDLQSPTFNINSMPGICQMNRGNMLRITFDVLILPQMHGTKTNTVRLIRPGENDLLASVAYTIIQDGGLAVTKRADQDFVENGQTFNYIIDITNIGSVPLNNITMTDALPSCVQRAGNIEVRNELGNIITSFTVTGNIQFALPPTDELAPGSTLTVTIPVQKVSGSNCCNVMVTATGRMVTSNALQEANFGSELEPAACVRSLECCDVPDFEAQLVQRDGKFYVQITGGSVPLQEVDITMLDFHVEYSSPDCQPVNMGMFGQLSTTTNTLGGLVLSNGAMPDGSLSWGLGSASIVNGVIEFEVTQPGILDIPCCEYELTFCIKVRVKDVNCNVCEKTICYTAEPTEPPCDLADLNITTPGIICMGETISFTWSGGSPSGGLEIYLVNDANPSIYHVIATGVSNGTNSYTYTLPTNLPCDQTWYIVIKDPKSDCQISSKRFRVMCCEPRCDCGNWMSHDVKITQVISASNDNVQYEKISTLLQRVASINVGLVARCGEKITVNKGSYVLTAPDFACVPESCTATYRWEVQRVGDSQITVGTGKNFAYQFAQSGGIYNVKIIPICGGKECEPCLFQVHVKKDVVTPWPGEVLFGLDKGRLQ